jgi:hypothetical protein
MYEHINGLLNEEEEELISVLIEFILAMHLNGDLFFQMS